MIWRSSTLLFGSYHDPLTIAGKFNIFLKFGSKCLRITWNLEQMLHRYTYTACRRVSKQLLNIHSDGYMLQISRLCYAHQFHYVWPCLWSARSRGHRVRGQISRRHQPIIHHAWSEFYPISVSHMFLIRKQKQFS